MKINIKNMVCRNCITALRQALDNLGFSVEEVGLGYAIVGDDDVTDDRLTALDDALLRLGFQRIIDPAVAITERVKLEVLNHVNSDEPCDHVLSECISEAVGQDYKSVSRIFSAVEGRTIEKYYITAKIEKAKELISYGDLPLTEIAYRLGYSSVAFLSRQFKQETGMTPTEYKNSQHLRIAQNDL